MMHYDFTTEPQSDNTLLTVTWYDGETEIVSGEKLIKGHDSAFEQEAGFFAADLRRNFSDRFPPEPMPETGDMMDFGLVGGDE